VPAVSRNDAASAVCDLLQARASLERSELSARWVARELGQTTGFLYHHWGSFDAFLLEVSGLGWRRLVAALIRAFEKKKTLVALIDAYVDFALAHPVLYWLLAERPLPGDVVKERLAKGVPLPSFAGFEELIALLSRAMPELTIVRARALHAAAHGLVSQVLSHRLASMPDTFQRPEREVAREIAADIATAFSSPRTSRSPARGPKAASPTRPRTTRRRRSSP
jgi:AcrR family transcriptional regulator